MDSISIRQTATVTAEASEYIAASIAVNTTRAYKSQWGSFCAWCEAHGVNALPASPADVASYLAHLAGVGRKPSSIDVARAAIRKFHKVAGVEFDPTTAPVVVQTLKGIRRAKGTAPKQKAAIMTDDLRRMMKRIPSDVHGLRDKALLLLGFALGSRRSELVGLDVSDLQEVPEGLVVTIRRSKTDQQAVGYEKGVARGLYADTCPVTAVLDYLKTAAITEGPLFRAIDKGGNISCDRLTPQSVALVIKARAKAARLGVAKYSGHSLRAGMITQAAKNGATLPDIMRQSGHASVQTVTRYIRKARILDDTNASRVLGL